MPSGLYLLLREVNFHIKRMREDKPDGSSLVSVIGWFAYMSTLLSTLALRASSLGKKCKLLRTGAQR